MAIAKDFSFFIFSPVPHYHLITIHIETDENLKMKPALFPLILLLSVVHGAVNLRPGTQPRLTAPRSTASGSSVEQINMPRYIILVEDVSRTGPFPLMPFHMVLLDNLTAVQPSVVDRVAAAITDLDPDVVFVRKWTDDLFPGLVVETKFGSSSLAGIDGVLNVWQSHSIPPPSLP